MSYQQPSLAPAAAAEQARLLACNARYLIATAARAPSIHNSQPWRFRVDAEAVELWADPARKTRDDAIGREMLISCGAALFGLRLAIRSLGYLPVVRPAAGSGAAEAAGPGAGRHGGPAERAGAEDARRGAAPAHPSRPVPGGSRCRPGCSPGCRTTRWPKARRWRSSATACPPTGWPGSPPRPAARTWIPVERAEIRRWTRAPRTRRRTAFPRPPWSKGRQRQSQDGCRSAISTSAGTWACCRAAERLRRRPRSC